VVAVLFCGEHDYFFFPRVVECVRAIEVASGRILPRRGGEWSNFATPWGQKKAVKVVKPVTVCPSHHLHHLHHLFLGPHTPKFHRCTLPNRLHRLRHLFSPPPTKLRVSDPNDDVTGLAPPFPLYRLKVGWLEKVASCEAVFQKTTVPTILLAQTRSTSVTEFTERIYD
jgi:hypothetical protein